MSDIKIVSEEELLLLSQQDCVRFALFCAEQVRDSWKGIPECVRAIETTERWLEGKASEEECRNTAYAATTAAVRAARATNAASHAARATYAADAVAYATYAVVHAARAVAYAAYAASHAVAYAAYAANVAAANAVAYATIAYTAAYGKPHLIDAQRNYYEELLYFDDIAEKLLLGEIV